MGSCTEIDKQIWADSCGMSGTSPSYIQGQEDGKILHSGTKKQPKEKVSGRISRGGPRVIRADVPGQKLPAGLRNPGKNKHLGADIHDPNARTSMTPRGVQKNFVQKNFVQKNFVLIFVLYIWQITRNSNKSSHPGGHGTTLFLEGFLEGSSGEVLLRRVLRRRPVRVSVGTWGS